MTIAVEFTYTDQCGKKCHLTRHVECYTNDIPSIYWGLCLSGCKGVEFKEVK